MTGLEGFSLFSRIITWNPSEKPERETNKTQSCLLVGPAADLPRGAAASVGAQVVRRDGAGRAAARQERLQAATSTAHEEGRDRSRGIVCEVELGRDEEGIVAGVGTAVSLGTRRESREPHEEEGSEKCLRGRVHGEEDRKHSGGKGGTGREETKQENERGWALEAAG